MRDWTSTPKPEECSPCSCELPRYVALPGGLTSEISVQLGPAPLIRQRVKSDQLKAVKAETSQGIRVVKVDTLGHLSTGAEPPRLGGPMFPGIVSPAAAKYAVSTASCEALLEAMRAPENVKPVASFGAAVLSRRRQWEVLDLKHFAFACSRFISDKI